MSSTPNAWPLALTVRRVERRLEVSFDDGHSFSLPAELLRVESPSAEVQGHSPGQRVTPAGKRQVAIAELQPVGNYAVRIVFDDGHATGIFSWSNLHRLGMEQDRLWRDYLDRLAAMGLSRDP